jgi:MFS family permease
MLVFFAALLWFVQSEGMALACLAALTFSYTFPLSMATTSLQLAAPSRLRGVASAYYFVVVSLIGYGIGPTAVPLITEHVFHDPARIGAAMSLIAVIFGSLSILLLSISVDGFRREVAAGN